MSKFTGKNREIAKWLGEDPKEFEDPGFCLGCGEDDCVCDATDSNLEDLEEQYET